jgi:hypothetical protein
VLKNPLKNPPKIEIRVCYKALAAIHSDEQKMIRSL